MAKEKSVSNEIIIAALIQHGTIKDAATAAGCSPRTVYDRMQQREFVAEYIAAKNDLVRKAVFTINGKLSEAIDAVAGIMNDSSTNPAVRLQAAQVIINNAAKFAERLATGEAENRSRAKPSLFDELEF